MYIYFSFLNPYSKVASKELAVVLARVAKMEETIKSFLPAMAMLEKYFCYTCGEYISDVRMRNRHVRACSGRRVLCQLCGEPLTRKDGLKNHFHVYHPDVTDVMVDTYVDGECCNVSVFFSIS